MTLSHAAPSLCASSLAWTNLSRRQKDPVQLLAALLKTATNGVNWCQSLRMLIYHVDICPLWMGLLPCRGHHATARQSWAGNRCAWSKHLPHPPANSLQCCRVPRAPQLTPHVPEQPAHGAASLTVAETRKTSRSCCCLSVSHCWVVRCCRRSSRMF